MPVIVGDGELVCSLRSEDIFECKIFGCEIISADINVNMDIGQQWFLENQLVIRRHASFHR